MRPRRFESDSTKRQFLGFRREVWFYSRHELQRRLAGRVLLDADHSTKSAQSKLRSELGRYLHDSSGTESATQCVWNGIVVARPHIHLGCCATAANSNAGDHQVSVTVDS
jgi:hypothetical protein